MSPSHPQHRGRPVRGLFEPLPHAVLQRPGTMEIAAASMGSRACYVNGLAAPSPRTNPGSSKPWPSPGCASFITWKCRICHAVTAHGPSDARVSTRDTGTARNPRCRYMRRRDEHVNGEWSRGQPAEGRGEDGHGGDQKQRCGWGGQPNSRRDQTEPLTRTPCGMPRGPAATACTRAALRCRTDRFRRQLCAFLRRDRPLRVTDRRGSERQGPSGAEAAAEVYTSAGVT
jgi:hypothetical protein